LVRSSLDRWDNHGPATVGNDSLGPLHDVLKERRPRTLPAFPLTRLHELHLEFIEIFFQRRVLARSGLGSFPEMPLGQQVTARRR
jgi:hypothetical protein